MREQLNTCKNLPSLPAVALKIIKLANDPNAGLGDISKIISSDPALSVKILKVVNSSMYSQRRAVNNLRESLTLLGLNAALSITLSFSLINSFKTNETNSVNQENYWKRSVLSAAISRIIGTKMGLFNLEDIFLASLLQDIGILAFEKIEFSPYDEESEIILHHADRIHLEKAKFNVDHAYVGAWLLELWGLPQKVVNSVRYSHSLINNSLSKESLADDTKNYRFHSCVNLSGFLADIWLEAMPPDLLEATKEASRLMLDIDIDEFAQLVKDINNELPEISNLFEINFTSEIERGHIVEEAREISLERSINVIKESEKVKSYVQGIEKQVRSIEVEIQYDHLTKVHSRKYIETELIKNFDFATSNSWPISLAFIDIDNFKEFNDKHGHSFGDTVLVAIAEFYSKNIRQTDILARYGGDEFILLLPGATLDIAEETLKRLIKLQASNTILESGGNTIVPTVSIGVASHMDKNKFDNLDQFVKAADKALYASKEAGRNCVTSFK